MGYVPKPKTYRLVFDDEEFAGLEVTTKSLSLGSFMATFGSMPVGKDARSMTAEDQDQVTAMFRDFAEVLVAWNVEREDGSPVPATLDGMRELELPFVLHVINAWMTETAGVPGPLDGRSTSGGKSLEASMPTEPLSSSPTS